MTITKRTAATIHTLFRVISCIPGRLRDPARSDRAGSPEACIISDDPGARPVSTGRGNCCVQRRRKTARERVAACTTGSSQKIAAEEKPLVEGIRRLEWRRLPETMRGVRRHQSHVLKACLAPPQERNAATPKRLPWRGYSPDGEHLDHQ